VKEWKGEDEGPTKACQWKSEESGSLDGM